MTETPAIAAPRLTDGVIGAVGFLSFWDRFALPPMLVVLASSTDLSLAQAVQILATYTLLYAVGQPVWGLLSDRFGRLTVLRLALGGLAVGAVTSSITADFTVLLLARAVAGLSVGAFYPTMMTTIGDTRRGLERSRSLSSLQAWSASGHTLTTLVSGTMAALIDWRLVFGLPAIGALGLLVVLRHTPSLGPARATMSLRAALTPWALVVYVISFVEGATLYTALSYLVPAMQHAGLGVTLAGILAASYGVGIIVGAVVMRRVAHRVAPTVTITIGGLALVLGCALAAFVGSGAALTGTAVLLGLCTAIMHVNMQDWATQVAPDARATSIAIFAGLLFLGTAVATFLTAELADAGRYDDIFTVGVVGAAIVTVAAATLHRRWETTLGSRHAESAGSGRD